MNIRTLNQKTFIIETVGVNFFGNREQIIAHALNLGVEISEVELALRELEKNGDNYAHFGHSGKFIYSDKKRAS